MTTFTARQKQAASKGNQDAVRVTLSACGAVGNLLVAMGGTRAGASAGGPDQHNIVDSKSGVWTKRVEYGQAQGSSTHRQEVSVWTRLVTAADVSSSFTIDMDHDWTNVTQKRLMVFEIVPSAAYDFTYVGQKVADSGTTEVNAQSSGTSADPGGSDNFLLAFAQLKTGAGSEPTVWGFTTTDGDNHLSFIDLSLAHAIEIGASGVGAGGKETTFSQNGSTDQTITGILIFNTAGAAPGGLIKHWNGSAWAGKPVKHWNGSAWTQKPLKRWTGTAWV